MSTDLLNTRGVKEPQAARWLLDQLPELVAKSVIDAAAAESLKAHYASCAYAAPAVFAQHRGRGFFRFSVDCSSARVSSCFSRTTGRWFGALGAHGACVFAARPWRGALRDFHSPKNPIDGARRRRGRLSRSRDWRLHRSLIGQTYQLSGSFTAFMLAWMLLALPLVYLLGSTHRGHYLRGRDYHLGG